MLRRLSAFVLLGAFALAAAAFPFLPLGTASVAVTGAAQTLTLPAVTLPASADAGLVQTVLTNVGAQTIFVRTDGTPATLAAAMPILPNSQIVISGPRSLASVSVIAGATGSTLYATVGAGQ